MGDVSKVVGGGTPRTDHPEFFGGGVPWITPADLSGYQEKMISKGARSLTHLGLDKSGAHLLPAGTVLFSSRAPIGYVAIAENPVATNQGFKSFVLGDELLPDFVYHWLHVAKPFAVDLAGGTTFKEISGASAGRLPVPVPPTEEQVRIVAEIEERLTDLDAGVFALRRAHANLKRYRASVLKAACEGRLLRDGNRVDGRWREVTLLDVVESMKNGIYKPRDAYALDGVACLRMYNIEDGQIVWKNVRRMKLSDREVADYGLDPGDILVNRVNSRELVGKAAPIPPGLERCVFESKNIRVRLRRREADPQFVGFVITVYGPTYFNRNAQQVVGMASISQAQVGALKFRLPPLDEQLRIVADVERRLSVIERTRETISAINEHSDALRASILTRAFGQR